MRFTYFSFPVAFSFQSLNSHHFSSFLLNVCLYFYAFYCFVIQSWDSSLTSFLFMWHLLFSHFIIYLPNLLFPYVFLVTNSFFSVFLLIRLLFFLLLLYTLRYSKYLLISKSFVQLLHTESLKGRVNSRAVLPSILQKICYFFVALAILKISSYFTYSIGNIYIKFSVTINC